MGKGRALLQRLADGAELMEENVSSEPILELWGDSRVLIEHHLGVAQYDCDLIRVRIPDGMFCVEGENLMLCRMCAQQLLIRGKIFRVSVRKGMA